MYNKKVGMKELNLLLLSIEALIANTEWLKESEDRLQEDQQKK